MGTGLLTLRANFTHTGGERGRIVAIMVLRTGLQGVCHIGSCFPQPWPSPSRAAEGALTSSESGASTLSASGSGCQRQPLYWAFGEVGRSQDDCPRLGLVGSGGTVELIRGLFCPPTLGPCSLLGHQGPASCHMQVPKHPCMLEKAPGDYCPGMIISTPKGSQSEQYSLAPGAVFLWSIFQQMKWRIPGRGRPQERRWEMKGRLSPSELLSRPSMLCALLCA